ncbi:MAG: rhodanese-like domain-containing protein [Sulfuricurvum sp.]|nr:rhodanese-like domain-containing protein [Sulfuricurvum sp.]
MTKKQLGNIVYAISFIVLALYLAYTKGWIANDFDSVSPEQAYTLLENEDNVTLLDVRTPEEFGQNHIQGAILIPVQVLGENLDKLQNVKSTKIIVYCHSGNRSVAASRILAKNGFIPLNLKGGITQWQADGFSVVR